MHHLESASQWPFFVGHDGANEATEADPLVWRALAVTQGVRSEETAVPAGHRLKRRDSRG